MTEYHGPHPARPLEEWHEDLGNQLWWKFPIDEPPYCGHPRDTDWPGYHTHWTPIPLPAEPWPQPAAAPHAAGNS